MSARDWIRRWWNLGSDYDRGALVGGAVVLLLVILILMVGELAKAAFR